MALSQTVVAAACALDQLESTTLCSCHLAEPLPVFSQAQTQRARREMHGTEDKATEINLLGTGFK